jgi:hypothetical protein
MCVTYTTPGVAVNMGGRDRPAYFLQMRTPVFSLCMPVGYLSSRGLCLADPDLSQRSPSLQSVVSVPVCYLACHVFAIADRCFS